ncbi:MAG: hypothetical protein IJU65_01975 [Desulfovibrio sp.]|nr:hypothetical protein [Desulfovibrio sp.]
MNDIIRCSRFDCISPWELFERWEDITENEFLDLINLPKLENKVFSVKLQPYERILPLSGNVNEDVYILKPILGKIFSYKILSDQKFKEIPVIYYIAGDEKKFISNKINNNNICNNILYFLIRDINIIEDEEMPFLKKYDISMYEKKMRDIEIENFNLHNRIMSIINERPFTLDEVNILKNKEKELYKKIDILKNNISILEEKNKILDYIYGIPKLFAKMLMSGKSKEEAVCELSQGNEYNRQLRESKDSGGTQNAIRKNGLSLVILGALVHETGMSRDGKIMDSQGFEQVARNMIKQYTEKNIS